MAKQSGIYLITCAPTGMLPRYYVGQSVDIKARFSAHICKLRKGLHDNQIMQKAWVKCGEASFSFDILELLPKIDLNDAETWWLDGMHGADRCFNIERKPGHVPFNSGESHYAFGKKLSHSHRRNISFGGLGRKRAESTKVAISKATTGKNNAMFGMRGALHNRSKAVIGTNPGSGKVIRYESAMLAEADGFQQASISRCCNGNQGMHMGYQWSFVS